MLRYRLAAGVVLHCFGDVTFAYSGLAGETHRLNDSGASLLECLQANGEGGVDDIAMALADLFGVSATEVNDTLAGQWDQFIEAGLIETSSHAAQPI